MSDISDEELMMMFQCGNVHAFELLFERHRTHLFNFIYRMLDRNRQDSEDLLQEIFVKLIKAKDLYEPKAKFSTWLFTVARNHCLNFVKSRRYLEGRVTVSLDEDPEEDKERLIESLPAKSSGSSEPERREVTDMIERAISQMPPNYKETFILHAVQGFSHEEIGDILKMNVATVRTTYHRARRLLMDQLGETFPGERG